VRAKSRYAKFEFAPRDTVTLAEAQTKGSSVTVRSRDQLSGRQRRLLEILEQSGGASVRELSERCSVSEMTIRRDLDAFERAGLVKRHFGGAVVARRNTNETPLQLRSGERREEKERIARHVVGQVREGSSLALGNGSTTLSVAAQLGSYSRLTVLSPSLHIALVLAQFPAVTTLVPGITVRSGEASMVGPEAARAVADFFFDLCIVGAAGVDASIGVTEHNVDEASVIRAMLGRAARSVVVADSSKIGRIATVVLSTMSTIDEVVTGQEADNEALEELRAQGVEVTTV
jgi:DeoR/GlpR family transcriptional regulator of sugar metabolism